MDKNFVIKLESDGKNYEISQIAQSKEEALALFLIDVKQADEWIKIEQGSSLTLIRFNSINKVEVIDVEAKKEEAAKRFEETQKAFSNMNRR